MSTLLMIGNGFDIEAKIPSKFIDFAEFKTKSKENVYKELSETLKRLYNGNNKEYKGEFKAYSDINDLMKKHDISFWEYYLIYEGFDDAKNLNWMDFEEEIFNFFTETIFLSSYVYDIGRYWEVDFERKEDRIKLMLQYIIFSEELKRGNNTIKEKTLYDFLLEDLKLFENKFKEYMIRITKGNEEYFDNSRKQFQSLLTNNQNSHKHNYLLNFNYTNPAIYVWPINFKKTINIHGSLDTSIIFGIDEKSIYDHCEPMGNIEHTDLFLYSKTFRKMERELYENESLFLTGREWGSISEIKIFGLSLGESDYIYFQTIFDIIDLYNSNVRLIFYYNDHEKGVNAKKKMAEKAYKLIKSHSGDGEETYSNKQKGLLNKLLLEGRLEIRKY